MRIECPSCNGTGICATLQAGNPPAEPHSCCGDCNRITVPAQMVPEGFVPIHDGTAMIGSGYLDVGFWRWLGIKLRIIIP